jgi:hypothetical protein
MTGAQGKPCTQQEAEQAERETDALKTWNSVYRFYKKFSQCDDGGIAEGVSDAVAKLLANRWDSLSELVKLVSSENGVESFVLRHVDETIDWEQDVPKIRQNAKSRCPPNSTRLCKALLEKTSPQRK